MYYYQYFIAGMRILCRIPFPVVIQKEAEQFLFSANENCEIGGAQEDTAFAAGRSADAVVTFRRAVSLPDIPDSATVRADRYYSVSEENDSRKRKYQVHYCPCPGETPYACAVWGEDACGRLNIICRFLPGNEFRFGYSRMISDHIGMETLFLRRSCLMLHAAFIRWQGKGILFTAPSGTGKSTQAELWKKYEGADILNGDRAAVRRDESGCWQAYGLPYAGSSGIYRNEKAPVLMIVVLRQSKENRIRSLGMMEIVQFLYPETTVHHWEPDFVEKALTLLTELAGAVPFYLLECRPDAEAVEVLKNVLIGGGDI